MGSVFGREANKCLPRKVVVHGHWIKDGYKMSKSIGNIVDPLELINKFDINPLRLYFLTKGPLHRDMEFSVDEIVRMQNDFFLDSYMNLLFRVCGKKVL